MALSNILRVFRMFANPARGSGSGTISEMEPSYAPKYPFNEAKETASGHLVEYDDTPNHERIQITHRTGSHIELRPDGSVKFKSTQRRQDVTIGDHEIIVQGDFNITVDGGSKIYVRNGSLEIQADYGAAVNVKGELKLSADNIRLQAKKKIALVAPAVDIGGGVGMTPYMSLPTGIAPVFGVPVPILTGLPITKIAGIPVPSGSGLDAIAGLVTATAAIANQVNTVASYASNIGKSKQLIATMIDSAGNPLIPQIDQPEELPLANPKLYSGIAADRIRLRDRQFDSPDDVNDSELYTAHVNLMEELKDIVPADKDLPGQIISSDTDAPTAEPIPAKAFALTVGTVSCKKGSRTVLGKNTKFTEELEIGKVLNLIGKQVKIANVLSDTELLLEENWAYPNATGITPYVYMLRPFVEFCDLTGFAGSAALGESGYVLADLLRNYIPPTIEKDSTGITVPAAPGKPSTTVGGGGISVPKRDIYKEAV